jgi:hypothetical protein
MILEVNDLLWKESLEVYHFVQNQRRPEEPSAGAELESATGFEIIWLVLVWGD